MLPVCRLRFKQRHARERALLCGSAVGSDAASIAVPFVEALAGPAGVAAACSALVANALAGESRCALQVRSLLSPGVQVPSKSVL
jgi:hypothetical protein